MASRGAREKMAGSSPYVRGWVCGGGEVWGGSAACHSRPHDSPPRHPPTPTHTHLHVLLLLQPPQGHGVHAVAAMVIHDDLLLPRPAGRQHQRRHQPCTRQHITDCQGSCIDHTRKPFKAVAKRAPVLSLPSLQKKSWGRRASAAARMSCGGWGGGSERERGAGAGGERGSMGGGAGGQLQQQQTRNTQACAPNPHTHTHVGRAPPPTHPPTPGKHSPAGCGGCRLQQCP